MTPAEYKAADDYGVGELMARGFMTPFEKEFIRKDGSRVPVILGGALFPRKKNEGVSFILDITVRKAAERALRESE
jgi:PAS domain S-box-containing protein